MVRYRSLREYLFYPAVAGSGNHLITYSITDANGCTDTDSAILTVATPDATITPVDTLCEDSPAVTADCP
jgi:hypothetical protein